MKIMQHFNGLFLTPAVNKWLGNTRQPRILHVFDRVTNLINERREVLSIVTPQIGSGPFNLIIDTDIIFSEHLYAESQISVLTEQLDVGDLTINIADARLWNPRPDWKKLHARRDEIFDKLLSSSVLNCQPSIPSSLVSNLSPALINADISTVKAISAQLAGLGIGLTPSGDDFLMGAVYAVWIMHPIEIATALAREIAESAAPLTTSLSAAWLRSAGRGEAGILWHEFFEALTSEDSAAIQLQISKLLSVGHTSGADMLAGFIGTFLSLAESETKLCHS